MIDLNKCEGWQKRDKDDMVMPWYTHSALDEIERWDLSRKRVFEYGIGQSTIWWAKRCEWIYGVDSNPEWVKAIHDAVISNSAVACVTMEEVYVLSVKHFQNLDIIVVDGDYRDKCIYQAVLALRPGRKLIIDNWDQPSVWIPSDETKRIVLSMDHTIYKQEGHPDWQTLIATK